MWEHMTPIWLTDVSMDSGLASVPLSYNHSGGHMRKVAAVITLVVIAVTGVATEVVIAQKGGDASTMAALAPFLVTPVREGIYLRMLPRGGPERLGVTVYELSPQLASYFGTKSGVLIASVRNYSPADYAGLTAGDVITSVDGIPVSTTADLRRALHRDLVNVTLSISVTQDRRHDTVEVKVK